MAEHGFGWAARPFPAWYCVAPALALVLLAGAGCRSAPPEEPDANPVLGPPVLESPADPALAATLQAEAAATAAWVAQLTPFPVQVDTPLPTLSRTGVAGALPIERTGSCPVPEGFVLHVRSGFCVSAPELWTVYNVDGGLAASLRTTPGQAISLRPDWVGEAFVCDLMVYIAAGDSPLEQLQIHYDEYRSRDDLAELSPVAVQTLGEIAMPGFTWALTSGESGGIFIDTVGMNRLAHVNYGGSRCPLVDLEPVLNTLRFSAEQ